MRKTAKILIGLVVLLLLLGGTAWLVTKRPALRAMVRPPAEMFAADDIARGATLAAIGDCAVCHTAPGGRSFAGGRMLATPFGSIGSTNITPDVATGIGTWSEAAFRRALRQGVSRDGHYLYPAFPYDHFTHMDSGDITALYAFLMTRAPMPAPRLAGANHLVFPLNIRAIMAGWNWLYLRQGLVPSNQAQDAVWNRGAYLVESVGHCGACHTPRNALGAELAGQALAGGMAEGWVAPALNAASPAREPWTEASLFTYLRTGIDLRHGAATGPMGPVTHHLGSVPAADLHAIATYIASFMPQHPAPPAAPGPSPGSLAAQPGAQQPGAPQPGVSQLGAVIFAGACAGCHGETAPMTRGGRPTLALSSAINAATPRDAVQTILHGIPWQEGTAQPYMPSFAASLTDAQLAALVAYLRARYSDRPAWHDIAADITDSRSAAP